jgi:hypothetical protein
MSDCFSEHIYPIVAVLPWSGALRGTASTGAIGKFAPNFFDNDSAIAYCWVKSSFRRVQWPLAFDSLLK